MTSNKSEIYAMGYEKWEGKRERALPAWFLIGQHGLQNLISSSGCVGRLLFIVFYVIYYFWMLLASTAFFQWENLKTYTMFSGFSDLVAQSGLKLTEVNLTENAVLVPSIVFSVFAMLFYGSQLISKDKRANAMQVYFSKAISRTDYILGKYFAVGAITGSVTLVPTAVILVMGMILTTDHLAFFSNSWYIPLLTGTYWLLLTTFFASLTLVFSSLFNKSYMAGIGVIGFLFFWFVFSFILVESLGAGNMIGGTNWIASIYELGTVIFGMEVTDWSKLIWQVIDLVLLVGISLFLIARKIRPVEVVT